MTSLRSIGSLLAVEEEARASEDYGRLLSCSSNCSPLHVWREKVAQWCYDVADHLGEKRSSVYVALNILDRYCSNLHVKGHVMDERAFELSSMTSMFIALRISGSEVLRIQDLLNMSRDGITMREFVSTGTDMIKCLSWNYRVTSPSDFLLALLEFLPPSSRRTTIVETTSYVVELSVCDVSLSHCKASDIALAAMMNVLQDTHGTGDVELFEKSLKASISAETLIKTTSPEFTSLRGRLHRLHCNSYDKCQKGGPHLICEEKDEEDELSKGSCVSLLTPTTSGSKVLKFDDQNQDVLKLITMVSTDKRSAAYSTRDSRIKRFKADLSNQY